MSGYYPPNQNIPPQYYNVDPNAAQNPHMHHVPSMMAPDGSITHGIPVPESPLYRGMPVPFVQYADPHIQHAYMDQYDEVPGAAGSAQPSSTRMRRRAAPGDNVKHRRTRSGCFTCRQRRVKVGPRAPPHLFNPEAYVDGERSVTKIIQSARVSCATTFDKPLAVLNVSRFRMPQRKPRVRLS